MDFSDLLGREMLVAWREAATFGDIVASVVHGLPNECSVEIMITPGTSVNVDLISSAILGGGAGPFQDHNALMADETPA